MSRTCSRYLVAGLTFFGLGFVPAVAAFSQQGCPPVVAPTVKPDCPLDFGESSYTVFGCTAGVVASWNGLQHPKAEKSCIANPPPGTMIFDVVQHEDANNNGSYTVDRLQGGLQYDYTETVTEAYESAIEAAGKLQKYDLVAKLKNEEKRALSIVEHASTNKDTVRVAVEAEPHGSPIDRKRGWETAHANLVVRCVAPLNMKDQVFKRFGLAVPAD